MANLLELEIATFERLRSELATRIPGRFVVVRGDAVEGDFGTRSDALRAAYKAFGREPFLVKKVEAQEEPVHFVSALIRRPTGY